MVLFNFLKMSKHECEWFRQLLLQVVEQNSIALFPSGYEVQSASELVPFQRRQAVEHLLENILDVILAPHQHPVSDVIEEPKKVLVRLT